MRYIRDSSERDRQAVMPFDSDMDTAEVPLSKPPSMGGSERALNDTFLSGRDMRGVRMSYSFFRMGGSSGISAKCSDIVWRLAIVFKFYSKWQLCYKFYSKI